MRARQAILQKRVRRSAICFAMFLLPTAATLAADRPDLYRKHPDWKRTLGESRKALAEFRKELKRSELFATGTLRGSDAAKKITVDVSRAEVLWLGTGDAGDGNSHDVGVWGSPVLIARDGSRIPLVKLKPFVSEAGRGSAKLGKATIGKQALADSISCQATGRIGYRLARRFRGFEAAVPAVQQVNVLVKGTLDGVRLTSPDSLTVGFHKARRGASEVVVEVQAEPPGPGDQAGERPSHRPGGPPAERASR